MSKRLNRREFIKMLGLGSSAALLSSCATETAEPVNQTPTNTIATKAVEPPSSNTETTEADEKPSENLFVGYMLIKTQYRNDEGTVESTPTDSIDEVNLEITKSIISIVADYNLPNPRGAIVESEDNLYNIVISLGAHDREEFDKIADEINKIEVVVNSSGTVSEVIKATDKGIHTGLEGLP